MMNSVEELVRCLKEKNLTISAAESLTGGLFQQSITAIPGAGEVFVGGMVTYASWSKVAVLGVPKSVVDTAGVVSEVCAREMALAVRKQFQTDIGIGFTGVAGPDTLEGQPVGTVFIGFALKSGETFVKHYRFEHGREGNRLASVESAAELLLFLLKNG